MILYSSIALLLTSHRFTAFMDQKPIKVTVAKTSNPWSGLQQRQLSVISEYPACSDKNNCVVDCLSRARMWPVFLALDYAAMVADQRADTDVHIGPVGGSCRTPQSEEQLRYNPQGKGLCERFHEMVKASVRASLRATGVNRGYCSVFIQPPRRSSRSHLLSWCSPYCHISPLPSPLLHLQEPGIIWIRIHPSWSRFPPLLWT